MAINDLISFRMIYLNVAIIKSELYYVKSYTLNITKYPKTIQVNKCVWSRFLITFDLIRSNVSLANFDGV